MVETNACGKKCQKEKEIFFPNHLSLSFLCSLFQNISKTFLAIHLIKSNSKSSLTSLSAFDKLSYPKLDFKLSIEYYFCT